MFWRIRNYFYERRSGFVTTAGVVGTVYMAGRYVMDRLEEMREQAFQAQKAREILRRRFQQNQEDVLFTIMTRLPILSKAMLEGMDVESVTRELQTRSRAARAPRAHSPNPAPSESSLASSVELVRDSSSHDGRSDVASSIVDVSNGLGESTMSAASVSTSTQTQSWVDEFSSQLASSPAQAISLAMPSSSNQLRDASANSASPVSNIATNMSDSIVSDSIASTSASASEQSHSRARPSEGSDHEGSALSSKTKAELWNEVKMLTFTRTLTIIYSTTLLSLLTIMQLNIIGRSKYVQSIIQLHRDEKLREQQLFQASIASLFFQGLPGPEEDLEQWLESDVQDIDLVTEETERKFLTLSWWLLYVGWKDVGERVRRSVEEVFEGVSLKTKLGPMDLHRLICDVRRRVEYEVTYEGTERRINFLSTVIPPTPETLALVLGEGGVPGYPSTHSPTASSSRTRNPEADPAFARLLAETRAVIASPAFARVLEACLDRATDVLFDNLRHNIFGGEPDEVAGGESEKMRLAGLLPGLARWGHLALNAVPNELIDGMADLKESAAFAAIIFSSYDDHLQ